LNVQYSSPRSESTAEPSTKASREKIRRDKLNERYVPRLDNDCISVHSLIFLSHDIIFFNYNCTYDILFVRFLELGAILEPGKTPKMDKSAILNDAIRVVGELRSEAKKLKDSNESLQEKIKELKVYPISYGQAINGAVQMGDGTRFFV